MPQYCQSLTIAAASATKRRVQVIPACSTTSITPQLIISSSCSGNPCVSNIAFIPANPRSKKYRSLVASISTAPAPGKDAPQTQDPKTCICGQRGSALLRSFEDLALDTAFWNHMGDVHPHYLVAAAQPGEESSVFIEVAMRGISHLRRSVQHAVLSCCVDNGHAP